MSATRIGSPAGRGKVLNQSSWARDLVGLETLEEVYTVRTEDAYSLVPVRNTRHSEFSSATTKYTKMVVENVGLAEKPGSLTEMRVQYIGVTSTRLPPPVVRIIPVAEETADSYFSPNTGYSFEVKWGQQELQIEFLSETSMPEFLLVTEAQETGTAGSLFGKLLPLLPSKINGYPINPSSPNVAFVKADQRKGSIISSDGSGQYGSNVSYGGFRLYASEVIVRGLISIVRAAYRSLTRTEYIPENKQEFTGFTYSGK